MGVAKESESTDTVKVHVRPQVEVAKGDPMSDRDSYVEEPIYRTCIIEVDKPDKVMTVVDDDICHAKVVVAHDQIIGRQRRCREVIAGRSRPRRISLGHVTSGELVEGALMLSDRNK